MSDATPSPVISTQCTSEVGPEMLVPQAESDALYMAQFIEILGVYGEADLALRAALAQTGFSEVEKLHPDGVQMRCANERGACRDRLMATVQVLGAAGVFDRALAAFDAQLDVSNESGATP